MAQTTAFADADSYSFAHRDADAFTFVHTYPDTLSHSDADPNRHTYPAA